MLNVLLFLKYAVEELYVNNNKRAGHETNLYGVGILHSSNFDYKITEKKVAKWVSQKFGAD